MSRHDQPVHTPSSVFWLCNHTYGAQLKRTCTKSGTAGCGGVGSTWGTDTAPMFRQCASARYYFAHMVVAALEQQHEAWSPCPEHTYNILLWSTAG